MSAIDAANQQNGPPPGRQLTAPGRGAVRTQPQLTATDREFLPAALEILVKPPSPIARSLLLAICILFVAALAWSYFGWMDIYAVAPGKISPDGGSKVVQPLEPGKIVAIHVANGSHVEAGEVLLALDATELDAEREANARDLDAAKGEAARRQAAIAAARTESLEPLPIAFAADVTQPVRRREEGVLVADLAKLRSSIATLKAQLAEKEATKERLTSTIAARQKLIALTKERVAMREKLDTLGAGSRAQTIDALEQYENQVTTDTGDRGQLIETTAAMVELEKKIDEASRDFIADQSQKLATIEQKRDHLEEDLIKARSKASHTELKATISGTVQALAVSSVGQVVTSGQPLLTIVPSSDPVEIKAMIANQDIGFVKVGEPAVVKVDAFPFTRYGTIAGTVSRVSSDAVDARDATELSDAANAARPQGAAPGGAPVKTQDLVFPATIRLSQRFMEIDGKQVALMAGMGVSVEIKTGRRRAIDYLLSPLREVTNGAASER